jgi:hypothetical protein
MKSQAQTPVLSKKKKTKKTKKTMARLKVVTRKFRENICEWASWNGHKYGNICVPCGYLASS